MKVSCVIENVGPFEFLHKNLPEFWGPHLAKCHLKIAMSAMTLIVLNLL